MILTGVWLLLFVVIHLKTFKFGPWYETSEGMRDLSRLVHEVYREPLHVAFYVLSMVVVGLHLSHGLSSAFQSMGLEHPRYNGFIRGAGLRHRDRDGARLRGDPGGRLLRGPAVRLDAEDPRRSDRRQVGPAPLRDEAGEPGQQAQVHRSSWSAPAWPAPRPRRRSASWATTSRRSASTTRPRRAHSIAAQGGINAAKNYRNDGDSV